MSLRAGCLRARALALLALALAGGCGKTQLAGIRAHALVTPLQLDFGKTPLLFAAQKAVQIGDGGSAALHLTDAGLAGPQAAAFTLGPRPSEIAAGDTVALAIGFTAQVAGPQAATLRLSTDDPDQPVIDVALTGEGVVSGQLGVAPASLDFGRVGEGQTVTRELALLSEGTADVYLAAIGFGPDSPAAFGLVGSARAPSTLAAGASAHLAVRLSPTPQTAAGNGTLIIASSDPVHGQLAVPLTASINRAPVPLARGSVGGAPAVAQALTTAAGATVDLDGTGSSDPDGDLPLQLSWSLSLRPEGSAAQLGAPQGLHAQLVLDQPGLYSVLLDAQDSTGLAALAPSRLDIQALPPLQLVVELVWDQQRPDLDLHLLLPGAALGSAGDCGWTNRDPAWFAGGADWNPHHLGDQLVGYGPEIVQWKQPTAGSYPIAVVYKSANGLSPPAVTARVRVTAFGVVVAELSKLLQTPGEVWNAGTVQWPTGTVGP